ncbi:MAG TPA: Ku protein, partial [Thermoanaerobaculia bacterium]|nr:Ku protein [Thermoanaerobaculia bacterium]
RAIWKGVIHIGTTKLPVKLYSAVQDHAVHFRLLHRTDHAPVQQRMVNPESGETVEYKSTQKAFPVSRNRLVMLHEEELKTLEPKPSREIAISRFVDSAQIDHRWYERAYYLGPDGDREAYFAAAEALQRKKKEGVAHWVMRGKEYVGSLRAEHGYLALITLRNADEIIDAEALPRPAGRPLSKREVQMAGQLVEALAAEWDPSKFRDDYHQRVMDLIEAKAHGRKPKVATFRPRRTKDTALTGALQASLAGVKRRKSA